jgi:hypothetical protein
MENKFLDKLFEELKDLNKVPKFQLERAVSPLLGIFIREIINHAFTASTTISIPEFPLKKKDNNQSTNIDWLLIDDKRKILYCVELKTDKFSLRKKQSTIYKSVIDKLGEYKCATFLEDDINKILSLSKRKNKYKTITDKFKKHNIKLSDYENFEIIYLVPDDSRFDDPRIKRLNFSQLPEKVKIFNEEWQLLRNLLIGLSKQNKLPKPI